MKRTPQLPPSISLTPALPKQLRSPGPIIAHPKVLTSPGTNRPQLDSKSIADINNTWAESLLNPGAAAAKKRPFSGLSSARPQCPPTLTKLLSSTSPRTSPSEVKSIGSCTLTPATGNKAKPSSIVRPSISLQKLGADGKPVVDKKPSKAVITSSVTLTPANPNDKAKKAKGPITPTATITPVNSGRIDSSHSNRSRSSHVTMSPSASISISPARNHLSKKPLFSAKPLGSSLTLSKKRPVTVDVARSQFQRTKGPQQQLLPKVAEMDTPMLLTPDQSLNLSEAEDEDAEQMILEPQIFLDEGKVELRL